MAKAQKGAGHLSRRLAAAGAALAALALIPGGSAEAQSTGAAGYTPRIDRCEDWQPISGDRAGRKWFLERFYEVPVDVPLQGFVMVDGVPRTGHLKISSAPFKRPDGTTTATPFTVIAVWAEDARWFTVSPHVEAEMLFIETTDEGAAEPVRVTSGYVDASNLEFMTARVPEITFCQVAGERMAEAPAAPEDMTMRAGTLAGLAPTPAPPPPPIGSLAGAHPVDGGETPTIGSLAPTPAAGPVATLEVVDPVETVEAKPAPTPARAPTAAISSSGPVVCSIAGMLPMRLLPGASYDDFTLAALRNNARQVRAYDNNRLLEGLLPLTPVLDVSSSTGRLVPYQSLGTIDMIEEGADPRPMQPATFAGIGRDALVSADVLAAAGPVDDGLYPYRVLVVGAPLEISQSGLEAIDRDPKMRQLGDTYRLEIRYIPLREDGRPGNPLDFRSMGDVVSAARALVTDENWVVLNEAGFETMMRGIESSVEDWEGGSVGHVIVVLGGFRLPNSAPVTFSDFMRRMNNNPRLVPPGGTNAGLWLSVVFGDPRDLSYNYIAQPFSTDFSSNGRIHVEERSRVSRPRRFLQEPGLMATDLNTDAKLTALAAGSGSGSATDDPTEIRFDQLAVDSAEVFETRGIVISREALNGLRFGLAFAADAVLAANDAAELEELLLELEGIPDIRGYSFADLIGVFISKEVDGSMAPYPGFEIANHIDRVLVKPIDRLTDDEYFRLRVVATRAGERMRDLPSPRRFRGTDCTHIFLPDVVLWISE